MNRQQIIQIYKRTINKTAKELKIKANSENDFEIIEEIEKIKSALLETLNDVRELGETVDRSSPYKQVIPKDLDNRQISQLIEIFNNLIPIGIKVKKPRKIDNDFYVWQLDWEGDKAGLYLNGSNWSVDSLKIKKDLAGNWEGFDLMEHLDNNGVDINEW